MTEFDAWVAQEKKRRFRNTAWQFCGCSTTPRPSLEYHEKNLRFTKVNAIQFFCIVLPFSSLLSRRTLQNACQFGCWSPIASF
jgi:hypothetical protein